MSQGRCCSPRGGRFRASTLIRSAVNPRSGAATATAHLHRNEQPQLFRSLLGVLYIHAGSLHVLMSRSQSGKAASRELTSDKIGIDQEAFAASVSCIWYRKSRFRNVRVPDTKTQQH